MHVVLGFLLTVLPVIAQKPYQNYTSLIVINCRVILGQISRFFSCSCYSQRIRSVDFAVHSHTKLDNDVCITHRTIRPFSVVLLLLLFHHTFTWGSPKQHFFGSQLTICRNCYTIPFIRIPINTTLGTQWVYIQSD